MKIFDTNSFPLLVLLLIVNINKYSFSLLKKDFNNYNNDQKTISGNSISKNNNLSYFPKTKNKNLINLARSNFKTLNNHSFTNEIHSTIEYELDELQQTKTTIPIILPAAAELIIHSDNYTNKEKVKKNFSKLAKSVILASKNFEKKSINEFIKAARSFTTAGIAEPTRLKLFEIGGYCISKLDGLYDDPEDCENFIICYANRTFRTKCAYGTMWNHIRKECDFPEKVDCERKPTTIEKPSTTTKATSKKSSTNSIKPKLSLFTKTTSKSLTPKSMADIASIRTNILLSAILIPLSVIIVLSIIISLWFWNNKFKKQRLQENNQSINNDINDNKNLKYILCCCCFKKMPSIKFYPKQCRSKIIASCARAKQSDRIRINSNSSNTNEMSNTANKDINFIQLEQTNNNSNIQELTKIGIDECKIATNSHVTLSSHFEENNWDYNFATRGLYLSQPWVRGRYTQTLGNDSVATTTVLTLDPVTTEFSCDPNSNKVVEIYGETGCTDTEDGYYA